MLLEFLTAIVAPALFWGLYHYNKDKFRPEPLVPLGLAYLSGLAAAYAYLALSPRLQLFEANPEQPGFGTLIYLIVMVGGLEELAKFLPFWLVWIRYKHFDEPIDGIIYASIVALGFASYENLKYGEFLEGLPLMARAIASPLTHCMFASIWGWAFGRAKWAGRSLWWPLVAALPLAAAAHGLYDYLVLAAPPYVRPLAAGLILMIWIWRMRLVRALQSQQAARDSRSIDRAGPPPG